MKVQELLTERFQGGAYSAPGYRSDEKTLVGSVKDWMDAGGVKPEDIQKAVAQMKKTTLFKDLGDAGLHYSPSSGKENNGTLNFEVTAIYPKTGKKAKRSYQVYANGQIRIKSRDDSDSGYQTKLVSPKPRMVPNKPVESLVKTYTAALSELLTKWKNSKDNPANHKKAA